MNGTVVLSNTTLQIAFPSLPPAGGNSFTIVDNDGSDAGRAEPAAAHHRDRSDRNASGDQVLNADYSD